MNNDSNQQPITEKTFSIYDDVITPPPDDNHNTKTPRFDANSSNSVTMETPIQPPIDPKFKTALEMFLTLPLEQRELLLRPTNTVTPLPPVNPTIPLVAAPVN
jgi:hypothetical protein